jgi:multisubunit Na+/H+ antiporter MnhB subunit
MKAGAHIVLGAAARFYAPLIALFALVLLADRPPGGGIGFVAGLAFGLVPVLHALVFGAAAARQALPPVLARSLLALGVIAAVAGAGLPQLGYAPQLIEGGAFCATIAASALLVQVTFGRAPTLRDAEL